jgi:NAD(P)-dependent dehydrogenase (short-subunit alcohol dehydrogenase family)
MVTGGSRGIGAATAELLAGRGAKVAMASRHAPELEATALRLNELGAGEALAVPAHAGKPADLERLLDAVLERWGRLDILVNNASTNPYLGPIFETPLAAWDKTFEVNPRGFLVLSALAYRRWMAEHSGCVVNVASTGWLRPARGVGAYDVSKAGVVMLNHVSLLKRSIVPLKTRLTMFDAATS